MQLLEPNVPDPAGGRHGAADRHESRAVGDRVQPEASLEPAVRFGAASPTGKPLHAEISLHPGPGPLRADLTGELGRRRGVLALQAQRAVQGAVVEPEREPPGAKVRLVDPGGEQLEVEPREHAVDFVPGQRRR